MNAPTPEQMRTRADRLETSARGVPESDTYAQGLVFNALGAVDALRTAADQLEAVRQVVVDNSFQAFDGEEVVYSDLVMEIVYPADAAPQEDRDE